MRQAIPFGKYLLLDRISVGGMAEVFKAKSYGVEGFEKVIAIKRILPSMGEDRDFIKMFIDEAKIAGQLAHANICQIFELGRNDGAHFIAMEFIWGKDLLQIQNRLRKLKQTMSPAMACFIVGKACEGLDYAHRKRDAMGRPLEIVHRDCSPQNVLISYEGEVKIIDFGIAKAASRSSRTMHGVLKGKFGYMSPEQVRGLPLDRRSDLFALGTILYECLTGERLFQGDTDFATLEKVRNVDIVPPRQLNPAIPEEVERIILKALARDVEDRYQWCSELLADLQAFLMAQPQVFTATSLAGWMKEGFAPELERERQQLESYKKVGREGLIAGVPAAEARLDVVQHLGPAGQSEDPTMLGGPSFDDLVPEGATQISSADDVAAMHQVAQAVAVPEQGNENKAVAGEVAARDDLDDDHAFGEEEGPTTIFGDLEAPAPAPLAAAPVAPPRPPPTPGRATQQSPAVPPPSAGAYAAPAPVHAAQVQAHAQAQAQAQAKTLYGMPPPAVAVAPQHFPAGTGPGRAQHPAATPSHGYPATAAPGDPTVMGQGGSQLPVQELVAQAQAELARARASSAPPPHAASAPTVMGMQPPLPLQPGPPSGAVQAAPVHYGYAHDPAGYAQHGYPHASYPGYGAQPVFTPSGVMISPPTQVDPTVTAPVVRPVRRRRPSLGKDIGIGVAIAAAVLGVVAFVKFVLLDGDGAKRAEAVAAQAPADADTAAGASPSEPHAKPVEPAATGAVPDAGSAGEGMAAADGDAGVPAVEVDAGEAAALVGDPPGAPDAGADPGTPEVAKAEDDKNDEDDEDDAPKATRDDEVKVKKDDRKKSDARDLERKTTKDDDSTTRDRRTADRVGRDAKTSDPKDKKVVAADAEGYLVAYTTPWAKVLVDGKDTGKMTPVAPRAKIPLSPGKHKVTFVVGAESWSYTVTIKPGETSKITRDLPVKAE